MKQEVIVSVIMGAYNAEREIEYAIKSVQDQSFKYWELIICDDCSTDHTHEVVKRIAEKDSRILLIKNAENKKLAYSLNQCLRHAEGRYIARMDTDDICIKDRLEKQVGFLEEHPEYDVVGSAAFIDDGENANFIRFTVEKPDKDSMKSGSPFMHPTIMMRKEAYDKLGGYQVLKRTERGQDLDLWYRFFKLGMKGYNLSEPLLIYHESIQDYKKRTLKTALMYARTHFYGYRLLGYPWWSYYRILKPVIAACIPDKFMHNIHRKSN